MKPELTPSLKERFFAQYWGQKVKRINGDSELFTAGVLRIGVAISHLLLRPLSSITDDEAIEVAKMVTSGETYLEIGRYANKIQIALTDSINRYEKVQVAIWVETGNVTVFHGTRQVGPWNMPCIYQFLYSIGFAIPFMDYSVEELVAAGWVRLVEPENV